MIKIMHKRVTAVTIHVIPIADQRVDATVKVEDPDGLEVTFKFHASCISFCDAKDWVPDIRPSFNVVVGKDGYIEMQTEWNRVEHITSVEHHPVICSYCLSVICNAPDGLGNEQRNAMLAHAMTCRNNPLRKRIEELEAELAKKKELQ